MKMRTIGYINPSNKKKLGNKYVWGNIYEYGNPRKVVSKNRLGESVVCFGRTVQYGQEA